MTINKQITIIITGPKPVVSSKLIYDELGLKFLGTEEWEERGVIVFTIGHRMGSNLPFPETGLLGHGEPRRGPQTASPPSASRLLALPSAVKFFRYFTCISNSVYSSEIYSKDLCL